MNTIIHAAEGCLPTAGYVRVQEDMQGLFVDRQTHEMSQMVPFPTEFPALPAIQELPIQEVSSNSED